MSSTDRIGGVVALSHKMCFVNGATFVGADSCLEGIRTADPRTLDGDPAIKFLTLTATESSRLDLGEEAHLSLPALQAHHFSLSRHTVATRSRAAYCFLHLQLVWLSIDRLSAFLTGDEGHNRAPAWSLLGCEQV